MSDPIDFLKHWQKARDAKAGYRVVRRVDTVQIEDRFSPSFSWKCDCDCEHFRIAPNGDIICPECGTIQIFP